jgi:hypothetical protein
MNIHEQHGGDMTLDEIRRSAAEEEMFKRIGRERERDDAEAQEFERAGKRIREKEDTERRKKIRELQEELNVRDLSRRVPPPRGVVRPGEEHFAEEEDKTSGTEGLQGMSRRSFLKKAAIGGAALLGFGGLYRLFSRKEKEDTRLELPEGDYERKKFLMRVRAEGAFITEDQETMLDTEVMDTLKDYWKDVYTGEKKKEDENGRETHYDIPGAYERMRKHDKVVKAEFEKQGVSPDLRFLSIVESNWNNFGEKYSWKTAGGLFQFMAETAVWLGFKVDRDLNLDERFIPQKSAWAAAKYLKWMMKGNGNNPDLALHEYNGSFALRYRRRKEKGGSNPSYEEFLEHMAAGINKRRKEVIRYKGGEKAFRKDLRAGWEGGVLGNYKENIEYTAKVRAVIELVNDPAWREEHGFE